MFEAAVIEEPAARVRRAWRKVTSPTVLAAAQPDPARSPDRLSTRWLLALAARLIRDVGALLADGEGEGKRVAAFAIDGHVRFASAADRMAFVRELTATVTALMARYHDESAQQGRDHRLVIAVHPTVHPETAQQPAAEPPKEI